MISQRQMNAWIPQAIDDFKAVMPPIDVPFPEIHILSRTTQETKRAEIVDRLRSPQVNQGEPAMMETLHGDAGDAILIYQKYFREDPYDPDDSRITFQHYLRHEL